MECQYCGSILKSVKSLKNHQKLAQYCLKKQQSDLSKTYVCNCGKVFYSFNEYTQHCDKCIQNKNKEIGELRKKISELKEHNIELESQLEIYKQLSQVAQQTIHEIAKQPRTQTNNTNNTENKLLLLNPLNLTEDRVKKAIEDKFTDSHFFDGQKGIARFAVDNLLKDQDGNLKYICTDPSRHIYKYKTDNGDIERDIRAKKLTSMIAKDVTNHSRKLAIQNMEQQTDSDYFVLVTGTFQDIKDIEEDNANFRTELSSLTILK